MTPEEFASYLWNTTWEHMLSAFVIGIGLGLLVKILNRS